MPLASAACSSRGPSRSAKTSPPECPASAPSGTSTGDLPPAMTSFFRGSQRRGGYCSPSPLTDRPRAGRAGAWTDPGPSTSVEPCGELLRREDPVALDHELTDLRPVRVVGKQHPDAVTAGS